MLYKILYEYLYISIHNYLIFQAVFTNCLIKKDYVGRERARGEQGQ
jgi:hypothetical protein